MQNTILSKGILAVVVTLFSASIYAQTANRVVKEKISNHNGLPSLISFNEKSTYKTNDFQQVFVEQLGLKSNSIFTKIKSETDNIGFTHERFQLFHQNIKVEFATYILHSKAGKIESMNGDFCKLDNVNVVPQIKANKAFEIAKNHIGATQYLWENTREATVFEYQKPAGELVLLPVSKTNLEEILRLAYKFDIYATQPTSRGDVYVDAVSGEVLLYNAVIKHVGAHSHSAANTNENAASHLSEKTTSFVVGNADTKYSGSQNIDTKVSGSTYILSDATRGLGINTFNLQKGTSYTAAINFTDVDNNWSAAEYNNINKDNGALDAHWGAEKTYDYWKTIHNRNSFDNAGAIIKSYAHYSNAYDNAFWNGSVMTYGDGSGTYFDILTSIDIVGHEIGHAICERTAALVYQKESGALNESLSDIWGTCIEFFAKPASANWLIGDEIDRRVGSIALRSLSDPKAKSHPDTYLGTYWKDVISCTPSSTTDQCGVHSNSGVLNHWFYILTLGKTGTNDIGSAYSVAGIGMDKAAKITYRMETVYMTSSTTYPLARTYGIQAAKDLYGINSPEVIAVTDAFYAVGVGASFVPADIIAPNTPTDLVASSITATGATLSWSAVTDNIAVTGYQVYKGTTLLATVTGLTYNVTGLTAATAYSFTIKAKDADGNLSGASNIVSFTTLSPPPTYCASKGGSVVKEYIDYVAIGGIANTTGKNGGYGNFTSQTGTVAIGTNTIIVSAGFASAALLEFWKVWIDYNKNGVFEVAELMVSTSSNSSAYLTFTFTTPTTALLGTTRMRVSMKSGAAQTACEAFKAGEVEDYTVNVGGIPLTDTTPIEVPVDAPVEPITYGLTASSINETLDFSMYPNPVFGMLNLKISGDNIVDYKIFNATGQQVLSGKTSSSNIDVAKLSSGIYVFEINDGTKTVSKKFIKK